MPRRQQSACRKRCAATGTPVSACNILLYNIPAENAIAERNNFCVSCNSNLQNERIHRRMETEYQNVAGKSAGEITRDIADFLALPCVIHGKRDIDLATLLPDLNMKEQFSFALLMEAYTQGWTPDAAEQFYLHACAPSVGAETAEKMTALFRNPESREFGVNVVKYGYGFDLTVPSYWSSCLKLAIQAKAVPALMQYLKLFMICLSEFAYMEGRKPKETYAWNYYETFQRILDDLEKPELPPSLPVTVRAVGGSSSKRENQTYFLSLGVDLQNPNDDRVLQNVKVDITLKDREGAVIDVISDQITSIDPGAVFHYGITRRVRGAAVAQIFAKAKASSYLPAQNTVMRGVKLERVSIKRDAHYEILNGELVSTYTKDLPAFALHYQYLNKQNKIVGGGCEWFFDGLPAGGVKRFRAGCQVPIPSAARIVYSIGFDHKTFPMEATE